MTPSQVSKALKDIASKIERSKNPDRNLVIASLNRLTKMINLKNHIASFDESSFKFKSSDFTKGDSWDTHRVTFEYKGDEFVYDLYFEGSHADWDLIKGPMLDDEEEESDLIDKIIEHL